MHVQSGACSAPQLGGCTGAEGSPPGNFLQLIICLQPFLNFRAYLHTLQLQLPRLKIFGGCTCPPCPLPSTRLCPDGLFVSLSMCAYVYVCVCVCVCARAFCLHVCMLTHVHICGRAGVFPAVSVRYPSIHLPPHAFIQSSAHMPTCLSTYPPTTVPIANCPMG